MPTDRYTDLADLLRQERAAWDMSLREAGRKLGLHHTTVAAYERGEMCDPPLSLLLRIAATYRIEMPTLIEVARRSLS